MTGSVWRKSPPKTTVMPPNGTFPLNRSLKFRSTASAAYLCCIGTSSHIISLVSSRTLCISEFHLILAKDVSVNVSGGIPRRECAVWPPSSSSAAIPEEATHKATFPLAQTAAAIVFVIHRIHCSFKDISLLSIKPFTVTLHSGFEFINIILELLCKKKINRYCFPYFSFLRPHQETSKFT